MKQNMKQNIIDEAIAFFGPQDNFGNIKFASNPEGREFRIVFKPRVLRWERKSVDKTRWIMIDSFGYNYGTTKLSLETIKAFYSKHNCRRIK